MSDDTAPAGEDWHRDAPAVGGRLGRYELRGVLGAGGMGVVFEAVDPELDRAVAVKILRSRASDSQSGAATARLRREGVTMARLTHPNVIRVYDVGVAREHVFVAMELVRGGTLADWVKQADRTPEQIIATYLQAGRGLAAAHDAGLVHRDFKPQNVLVGDDGRVLVTDFGLARAVSDHDDAATGGLAAGSPTDVVTQAGEVVGTPAFMAPEQLAGATVDARADQYSFCLSLWRALAGAAPGRLDTATTIAGGAAASPVDATDGAGVPARIRGALQRGLEPSPERRWPSMRELLAVLEPPRPRTWPIWVAAGLVAVLVAAVGAWALDRSRGAPAAAADPCEAPDAFGPIWNAEARDAVRAAFAATGASYAEASFKEVARQLDARGAGWERARREACEDTRVRQQQSDVMMDLRMACLDRRLADVAAFVALLRRADLPTVNGAAAAAATIGNVTACADIEVLARRAPLPADPATRATIAEIEGKLSGARASVAAGRLQEGLDAAEALIEPARATAHAPLLAAALAVAGDAQTFLEHGEPARARFEEAALAAEAGGDDALRFECEANLVRIYGYHLERDAEAMEHARRAEALLQRLGPDPRRVALLERQLANADWWAGRLAEGLARAKKVVAIYAELDPGGPDQVRAMHLQAILENESDDLVTSVATEQRALPLAEAALGENHPTVGIILLTLGGGLRRLDRFDEARAALSRALAITEFSDGKEALRPALVLLELATTDINQDKFEDAIPLLRRAVAINEKVMGPDHSRTAHVIERLGAALSHAGQFEEAEQRIRRSIAIHTKNLGPDNPATAAAHQALGRHFMRMDKHAAARTEFTESLRAIEASQGPDSPNVARSLDLLGDAEHALGHPTTALAHYRRALAAVTGNDSLRDEIAAKIAALTKR